MAKTFVAGIGWVDTPGVTGVTQDDDGKFSAPTSPHTANTQRPTVGTRPASGPVITQTVDGQKYYAGSPELAAARKTKADRFRNASRDAKAERKANGWTTNSKGQIVAPDGSTHGPNGLLYGPLSGAPDSRFNHADASYKAGAWGVNDPSKRPSGTTNPFNGGIYDPKSGFRGAGTPVDFPIQPGGPGGPGPVGPTQPPVGGGSNLPSTNFPAQPLPTGPDPYGGQQRESGGHPGVPYARPTFGGAPNQAANAFDNLIGNIGQGGGVGPTPGPGPGGGGAPPPPPQGGGGQGDQPQPGYGGGYGTSPGGNRSQEFRDTDGDGIDDRDQLGPGQPKLPPEYWYI